MQEVTIRLRFTTPCLGRKEARLANGQMLYRLPRDGEDRVVFLPAWWRERMQFAANLRSRGQSLVDKIIWSAIVDGNVKQVRRAVQQKRKRRRGYAVHEAFVAGDVIGVYAVLPTGLTIDDCRELLTLVGRYRGMSWFQSDDNSYGLFEVDSVNPTRVKYVNADSTERAAD